MLFEQKIRKKKMSPFYLEIMGGIIYHVSLFFLLLLLYGIIDGFNSNWVIFILILIPVCILLSFFDMTHVYKTGIQLKKDVKEKRILTQDVRFVNYDFSFAQELIYGGHIYTFNYLFYFEPYIRMVVFNYLPEGEPFSSMVQPKFFLEEVNLLCWKQRYYKKLRSENKQFENEVKKGKIYEISKKTMRKYKDTNHTILYMTYDKMQIFRIFFDLMNPCEFRLKKYEKSGVFISIQPIPGHEYPPEALECMEKINAMYP